jgi:hypothetical protein
LPAGSVPGVTGIQFGVRHNLPSGMGYVVDWGVCGPMPQELPDAGFPDVPGGNVIEYGQPVIFDTWFPFYWFAVYGNEGAFFGTGVHPGDGLAKFIDDSVPPIEDTIHMFGEVRWYVLGENDCVPPWPTGACCLPDGSCWDVSFVEECVAAGGTFLGFYTECDSNPCPTSAVDVGSVIESLSLAVIPNPSSGQSLIRYWLPQASVVTVEFFDAGGAVVQRMSEGVQQPGAHAIHWGARNERGDGLPSGVYLARIVTAQGTTTTRVVLAR